MANSWYFDEYSTEIIGKYKKDIEEYQKKRGVLPHEEEGFESILLAPKDYAEAVFAADCFHYLKNGTDFFSQFDKKLQESGVSQKTRNELNSRIRNISSGWGTESIIKYYLTKLYGYRPDLGIQDELIGWTKTELQRILQNPKTEAEVTLCQKYVECLAEKEREEISQREAQKEQETRIQRYIDRLQSRQGVYEKLQRAGQSHSTLLDILWNPKTREELDFCISYFGFQDDIKLISEAAKEGKVTQPDIAVTSDVVFYGEWYFKQPVNQAKTLYDLTVFEQTNQEGLMQAIQTNGKYSSPPTEEYEYFREWLDEQIIEGINREEIAKGPSSKPVSRFNTFAQDLHQRYLAGLSYAEEQPVTISNITPQESKEAEVREYAEQRGYQYVKTLVE